MHRSVSTGLCLATMLLFAGCGSSDPSDDSAPTTATSSTPTAASTADSAAPVTEGSFRALTYNVHGLPDGITGDDGDARMRGIAPLLLDYDVIGLQETFDEEKHGLLTAASDHPVHEWFTDKVEDSRVYGSGLAVLARAELVEVFTEHYDECHGIIDSSSDCLASKGFQVVRLRLGTAELDVYNTHHEAGGGDEDNAVRTTQVSQVLASMEGRSAGRAILLLGDTNLRPSDPPDAIELQRYADAGLRDACDEVACPEADHIDRFLLRDSDELALEVRAWANEAAFFDEEGVPLSDHPAISAEIGWSLR